MLCWPSTTAAWPRSFTPADPAHVHLTPVDAYVAVALALILATVIPARPRRRHHPADEEPTPYTRPEHGPRHRL